MSAPEQLPPGTYAQSPKTEIQDAEASEKGVPTDSHTLAQGQVQPEQDEKGIVQKVGATDELTDVGWGRPPDNIENPLIGGLSNEELWKLIRRFNKQIYHVKAIPDPPLDALDLNIASDEEFSPDKLRSNIERLYMTVIVGIASFGKHIVRLRSWGEPRRTGAFCAVYYLAWLLDLLAPTLLGTLLVLIVYPPSRDLLFPPVPLALVNSQTGKIQTPKAGVLGSHDSITGAPEKHKGEAVEQEASNLVPSVASVAVGSAAGKHEQGEPENPPMEPGVPDPSDVVAAAADASSAAQGAVPAETHDKTREPMKKEVWAKTEPVMHIIGDICDTHERFANALSPTPPFPEYTPRLRLAGVLLPAFLASFIISSYAFVKISTFSVGFGIFGDPIIRRGVETLNRKFPHWQKLLQLRNTLLKGVPTNAQLTLTLLRIGEANGAPLPPPPGSELEKAPSRPASLRKEDLPLDASNEEIDHAVAGQPGVANPNAESGDKPNPKPEEKPAKKSWGSSILGFFRGTTAKGVETKLAVDRVKAAVGSRHAKSHLGVLPRKGQVPSPGGPVEFEARFNGKHGAVVVDSSRKPSIIYFTGNPGTEAEELDPNKKRKEEILFTLPVDDIQELKKVGGMGWKGKLVVGWAEKQKEVVDGLLLVGPHPKQSYHVTAMKSRDYLFNRLVAMNGQVWEAY